MGDQTILEEDYDEHYEPTEDEVNEYAVLLGINPVKEPHLMYIAHDGINAPLPKYWRPCQDTTGDIYYFNFNSGESMWNHPCDDYYKKMVAEARQKIETQAAEPPPSANAASAAPPTAKKKHNVKANKEKAALAALAGPLGASSDHVILEDDYEGNYESMEDELQVRQRTNNNFNSSNYFAKENDKLKQLEEILNMTGMDAAIKYNFTGRRFMQAANTRDNSNRSRPSKKAAVNSLNKVWKSDQEHLLPSASTSQRSEIVADDSQDEGGSAVAPVTPSTKKNWCSEAQKEGKGIEKASQQLSTLQSRREEDADSLFGLHVAATLKRMEKEQKKELCKLKIQELLYKFQFEKH